MKFIQSFCWKHENPLDSCQINKLGSSEDMKIVTAHKVTSSNLELLPQIIAT